MNDFHEKWWKSLHVSTPAVRPVPLIIFLTGQETMETYSQLFQIASAQAKSAPIPGLMPANFGKKVFSHVR